jgi:hypothetical protein
MHRSDVQGAGLPTAPQTGLPTTLHKEEFTAISEYEHIPGNRPPRRWRVLVAVEHLLPDGHHEHLVRSETVSARASPPRIAAASLRLKCVQRV